MLDYGIDKGLVKRFNDSDRDKRGWNKGFFGFRKMFRDYLTKLNVPFYDPCCPALTGANFPVRYNDTTDTLERYNGTAWVAFDDQQALAATLTAFAGGGQGSATQLTTGYTNVTTVATAGDSVKLPAAVAGLSATVKNNGAANLAVFPATADTINGGSANASITLVPGAEKTFVAMDSTNWETSEDVVQSSSVTTNSISEATTDGGITLSQATIEKHTTFAVNTTATVLAANFKKGYFTSTSAAAVSLTTDTATAIGTAIGAVQGTVFDFYVDNSAGANTVTVILGAGIVIATPVVTGGNTLTVSTANGIGVFRLVFSSATAARAYRLG
jgi:hypothetical protein